MLTYFLMALPFVYNKEHGIATQATHQPDPL